MHANKTNIRVYLRSFAANIKDGAATGDRSIMGRSRLKRYRQARGGKRGTGRPEVAQQQRAAPRWIAALHPQQLLLFIYFYAR
jgi:hypothetical protein